jgi:hypothetical protein
VRGGSFDRQGLSLTLLLCSVVTQSSSDALAQQQGVEVELLRSDSRAPYVHRINLYDHDGQVIDPRDPDALPYSPARTCGKCHAYGQIHSGWHFNAGRADVDDGRPGEPWIFTDAATGTQLPLSKRGWPGTYAPTDAGLSDWQFLLRFGAHLPGGFRALNALEVPTSTAQESAGDRSPTGLLRRTRRSGDTGMGDRSPTGFSPDTGAGSPGEPEIAAADASPRWAISGPLEIDCLFCHAASLQHDPAEVSRQLERENLKWSATAAAGLAVVRGDAKKLPDDFDPLAPPNPDYPDRTGPKLVYDARKFDADDRVLFDLTRRAPPERCYFCHSQRLVGPGAPPAWTVEQDVHLAAGLLCVDCHRNGIDHAITRGYEGDPATIAAEIGGTLTCRGCHLGTQALPAGRDGRAGRLGAPYPEHKGIPLAHFEKLTCTACHSGPWPQDAVWRFQTAMGHGLGVATRERTESDPPSILGPIFARNERGELAPHRMLWPAFWGEEQGGAIVPLPVERVQRVARKLAARAKPREAVEAGPLSDDEIKVMLGQLAAGDANKAVVYVRDGLAHRLTADGALVAAPDPAGSPYLWPLAHDVRPAGQSLGVRGCTDCHAENAAIYFGSLAAADEGDAGRRPLQRMYEVSGLDPKIARAFNASFRVREAFKIAGFVCAGVIAVVLLRQLLAGSPWRGGK